MRSRVFQLVSAIAEFDFSAGHVTIWHGDNLIDACGWRGSIDRPDIEKVREAIADHLNTCPKFGWPLLPYTNPKPTNIPPLTARDVLPGECSEDNRIMQFGVITDAFEVEAWNRIEPQATEPVSL